MDTSFCSLLIRAVFNTVPTLQMAGEGGSSVWDSPQDYTTPAEPYCSPRLQDTLQTIRYAFDKICLQYRVYLN